MKRLVIFAVVLCFWAFGAEGADLKIGYVDFNKALNESENGEKTIKFLEEFIENKNSLVLKKEAEIKKLEAALVKQSSVLTPESRKDKEDQLKKLYIDFQRMKDDFQEEILKKRTELTQEIQKDLIAIVNSIGKKEGYTYILEMGMIHYARKHLDITEKVIKIYNDSVKNKK